MHKNKNTLTIIILCRLKKNLENTTYMHTYSNWPDQRSDLCFELWSPFSFWFVLWYASAAGGPRTDRCVFTHHVQSTEFATDGVRLKASRRWLGERAKDLKMQSWSLPLPGILRFLTLNAVCRPRNYFVALLRNQKALQQRLGRKTKGCSLTGILTHPMISCCLSVKPCKAGLNCFYAVQWNWSCDTLKRCCCVYPPHYVMDCQNKALRPLIMQLDQYVFCSLIDLRRADHGGYTSCVYAPTHTFMPPVLSSTQTLSSSSSSPSLLSSPLTSYLTPRCSLPAHFSVSHTSPPLR